MAKRPNRISILIGLATALFITGDASGSNYERRTPIVEAVENILPAVVNISTSKTIQSSPIPRRFRSPFDDLFNQMFSEKYQLKGLGSGVLVEGGYVITNNHVVSYEQYHLGPADEIYVNFYDDKEPRRAILIGGNPNEDVAILKLKGDSLNHYLSWGRSDDLMIGETVIAAGSALGQPFTVTTGIISALNRTMDVSENKRYNNLIQTNADINRGNSGGPLVNINGEFIGLNTMILSPSGGSVGLGFAIPVSRVKKIFDCWVNHIVSLEDQMGVSTQDLDPRIIHYFRQQYETLRDIKLEGVVVNKVSLSGLCVNHLRPWDIILELDGKPVADRADFQNRLEEHKGDELVMRIAREGQIFPVRLATHNQTVETEEWLGLTLQTLDNPWREWFELEERFSGLVILNVEPGSEAEQKGLKRGDVLVNLNNEHDLLTLKDLQNVKDSLQKNTPIFLQTYRLVEKHWEPNRIQIRNTQSLK